MRRGLRGATSGPPHRRPDNGFGRSLRPGPAVDRRVPARGEEHLEAALRRVLDRR